MSKTKNPFKIPKFNPAHNTIVIELTGDSLIAAEIANRSNGTELVRFTVRSFPAEGLSATWLRAVWHHEHFSEQRVIYCISSDMVDYKSLNMPVLPMAELEEGVKIEIESTGRNNGQKLVKIIDFKNQGQMLLVNTALVNNDILNEKIQLLKEAGLEIIWSGLRFQGLRNFINFNRDFFEDVHSGTVYLDFCEHQTELGIIQDEVLLYRRRLNWGLVDIQNREDPEAKDDFKNDIRLTLAAYQAETKQSIPGKLIAFNMTEAIKPICDNIVGSTFLAEPAFQGNDYQLTFWSTKDNGLVQIQYRFSSSEEKVFRSVGFWGGKPQEVVLLNKVKEWKFEYFRSKTKNWDLLWQPTQKTEIPSLVRVNVSSGKNIAALIIPIKIRLDESGVND